MKKRVKIEKGSTPGIDWVLEKITDLGYIPEELELEIEDWIGVVLEDKYVSYHEGGAHLGVTNISEIQVRYYPLSSKTK